MNTSRLISAAALVAALAVGWQGESAGAEQSRQTTPVPILMYHVIADPPAGAPYPQLYVSESEFAAQMRWLGRHGYHAVTQRAMWDHWHRGRPLPARPIVISFDDGYREVADSALPIMQARGWPGVLNLTVKNLRVSGGLSQRRVRKLIDAGWELASHTQTHPDLPSLPRRRPHGRGRRLAGNPPIALRRSRGLLLLSGRKVRRPRRRRRAPSRLPGSDHDARRIGAARPAVRAATHPGEPQPRDRRP